MTPTLIRTALACAGVLVLFAAPASAQQSGAAQDSRLAPLIQALRSFDGDRTELRLERASLVYVNRLTGARWVPLGAVDVVARMDSGTVALRCRGGAKCVRWLMPFTADTVEHHELGWSLNRPVVGSGGQRWQADTAAVRQVATALRTLAGGQPATTPAAAPVADTANRPAAASGAVAEPLDIAFARDPEGLPASRWIRAVRTDDMDQAFDSIGMVVAGPLRSAWTRTVYGAHVDAAYAAHYVFVQYDCSRAMHRAFGMVGRLRTGGVSRSLDYPRRSSGTPWRSTGQAGSHWEMMQRMCA